MEVQINPRKCNLERAYYSPTFYLPAAAMVRHVAVELRPFARQIEPGTVLWLADHAEAKALRPLTTIKHGGLGHPCVVMGTSRDLDYVQILIVGKIVTFLQIPR